MTRSANRSGWLHTFRSCIKTPSIEITEPPLSAARVDERDMNSSYKKRWRRESSQRTICSNFPGSCDATSAFRRRRMKGRMMPCSRETSDRLRSAFPSTALVSGLENHVWNSFRERKISGMRKCIRDQSSMREF
jgi:hypothetical protein